MWQTYGRWMGWMVVTALLAGGAVGCASTSFKSTWKDPSAAQEDLRSRRVAVLVVSPQEAIRRAGETAMAQELTKRGVQPILGFQILSSDDLSDRSKVVAKLRASGADAAVVMRMVDRRQEVSYVPGPSVYGPSFSGYWGYGWTAVSDPGYLRTDTVVSVETLVYSVTEDKLLWAGVSDTYNPRDVDKSIREVASKAAKEMKKAGLIDG